MSPMSPTSPVAITRDLGRAREAYARRGSAASKAAHGGSASSIATTSTSSIAASIAGSEGSSRDLMPSREIMIGAPDGASCATEKHSNTPSEYIKSMVRASSTRHPPQDLHCQSASLSQVFGGLDGIITTFAVVAAVAGAELSTDMVTLMGVANLVGSQSSNLYTV